MLPASSSGVLERLHIRGLDQDRIAQDYLRRAVSSAVARASAPLFSLCYSSSCIATVFFRLPRSQDHASSSSGRLRRTGRSVVHQTRQELLKLSSSVCALINTPRQRLARLMSISRDLPLKPTRPHWSENLDVPRATRQTGLRPAFHHRSEVVVEGNDGPSTCMAHLPEHVRHR